MPIAYDVTIDTTEKENTFRIRWHNVEANTEDFFEQSAREIMQDETGRPWQNPLDTGRKLFHFLDGHNRHLQRALDEAGQHHESLILYLFACKESADWPFELLAQKDMFLLPRRLHLVRCISHRGAKKDIPTEDRPLKLLFIASSPIDLEPELDFEKEEESIFKITETLAMDMEVEDSGSLEGLREKLETNQYDVVHLTCHADTDKDQGPYLIMETETGGHRKVFPGELWDEALIENPPRLIFLSTCRIGEAPGTSGMAENTAGGSFACLLVENYDVPAVLGWGGSVSDKQATLASKILYHELCRGKTILKAVQRVRYELMNKFESKPHPAWPLLRLFSNSMPLKAIVKEGQEWKPKPRRMKHIFLKKSQVQVLKEGFVGRRRQLQQSLRTLKQNFDKVGVLLLGTSGLGKSCLAGKICERFTDHTLIIVYGKLNAITLGAALTDAFIRAQDETGRQLLAAQKEIQETLADLCATSFKEKNYLLLLDDFEQNLEGADQGHPGPLFPEAVELLRILLHYLPASGNITQMIITSRYLFTLTVKGADLVAEQLEPVWLTSFQPAEQQKKVRGLKHVLNYADPSLTSILLTGGHGNPRLMEWLDILVGERQKAEVSELLEKIKDRQEEFIREQVIRELLCQGGDQLGRFLSWFSIFRWPVFEEGIESVAEKASLEGWKELLHLGRRLSLVEHDQVSKTCQVTPLLREELVKELKEVKPAHEAACAYYQKRYKACDDVDPILTEEWIFHALGCGKEDVASEQGGRLIIYLRKRLFFRESRRIGEWILAQKRQECYTKHDAFLLNELAITINDMGDQPKAIQYYQQALGIWKKVYGEKHQNVGAALNNLGGVYGALGNPGKALRYYQEALDIWKNVHEKTHPHVAAVLNNLGEAWRALGKPRKALLYYQEALEILKNVHGTPHPQIAPVLNNLGLAWAGLGNYRHATENCHQALEILKNVYGEKHPQVAAALNNLGSVLNVLGEHHSAFEHYQKALDIMEDVYGETHPQLTAALNNLGSVWAGLGEYRSAIKHYQKALDILKGVYGETHPQVAASLNNLGLAWAGLGDYHKAIQYYQEALDIDEKTFGRHHQKVAIRLNNLGEAFKALEDYPSAIEHYQQALDIDEKVFGRNHPKVAIRLNNLGEAYWGLKKKQTAKEYFEPAYVIFKEFLGEEHSYTVTAKKWLDTCTGK